VTLAAVWVEARGADRDALCFASDSRTTPGPIEGVTKVILFGRSDLAAVWAGDYRYATLLVNHLDAVFTASDAMRRRDVDLTRAFARGRVDQGPPSPGRGPRRASTRSEIQERLNPSKRQC
jgi:hypothetical protein